MQSWANPRHFPFESWAASNGFSYRPETFPFLSAVGSAAEAFFANALASRPEFESVAHGVGKIDCGRHPTTIQCQKRVGGSYVDFAVERAGRRIAVEIDGLTFHHRKAEQVTADYLRQRRITCAGYTIVRFTAQEAFADPDECWRQLEAIMEALA